MNAEASPAPTQSILVRTLRRMCPSRWTGLFGNDHSPMTVKKRVIPPAMYQPARQPIVSIRMPPTTRPSEKPNGWLRPMQENARLRPFPGGKSWVTMDTDDARCIERPTPWKARMMTSSMPVCDRPCPSINAPLARDPTSSTHRGPMVSAIEPDRRSVEAVARLHTEEGQRESEGGSWRSAVMVGSPTTTKPLITLAVRVTANSWVITTTCCKRDFRSSRGAGSRTSSAERRSELTSLVTAVVVVDMAVVCEKFGDGDAEKHIILEPIAESPHWTRPDSFALTILYMECALHRLSYK